MRISRCAQRQDTTTKAVCTRQRLLPWHYVRAPICVYANADDCIPTRNPKYTNGLLCAELFFPRIGEGVLEDVHNHLQGADG